MRVIGGAFGGRRLRVPRGRATRPTSDRVREALFSSIGPRVPGAHVLDLYAGSGALGIEALSRGASSAVFVERASPAVEVLRSNLRTLGLDAPVIVSDVGAFAQRYAADPAFDIVFVDPPYAEPMMTVVAALHALGNAGALQPGAHIIVERDRRTVGDLGADDSAWLELERRRTYGDTVLLYLRAGRMENGLPAPGADERHQKGREP